MTLVRQAATSEIAVSCGSEWKAGNVAETVSDSTQTLEEGCGSQDIPASVLIVRNGSTLEE